MYFAIIINFSSKKVENSDLSKILESSVLYADMLDHSLFRPIIGSVGKLHFFIFLSFLLFAIIYRGHKI